MGSWFKFVNKRETRRLAAGVTTETALSPQDVGAALMKLQRRAIAEKEARAAARGRKGKMAKAFDWSDTVHQERLYVAAVGDEYRVSYPFGHDVRVRRNAGQWIARVQVTPRGSGSMIEVNLLSWVEQDKEIVNKKPYLRFLDDLATALRAQVVIP